MYAFISGTLVEAHPESVVIDCSGIGYQLFIPLSLYEKLPSLGKPLKLYTHFVVRENVQQLYGFERAAERELFISLIALSGIGPKLGLALVGHLSLEEMQQAVACGDLRTLTRVPGVGKRTAERLLVEMKDRLPGFFSRDIPLGRETNLKSSGGAKVPDLKRDALNALVNLGYTQAMAQKALQEAQATLPEGSTLEELIRTSLATL